MAAKYILGALFALVLSACSVTHPQNTEQRQIELLNATVRVEIAGGGTGSGTVIGAKHILTNHHVVEAVLPKVEVAGCGNLEDLKSRTLCELEKSLGEMQRALKASEPKTTVRAWLAQGGKLYPVTYQAKVVAFDEKRDLALLEIDGEWPGLVAPLGDGRISAGSAVYVAGSPLGKRPHVVSGEVSLPLDDQEILGVHHMMATAPVAPGNSGGGCWRLNPDTGRYELVAVTRALGTVPIGFSVALLPHMSYFIPMAEIRAFLAKSGVVL